MKRRILCIFYALCVFFISLNYIVAYACWIFLSSDDLIQKSDTIIVGEIVEKPIIPNLLAAQYNNVSWKVKVKYYIKGEDTDSEISVETPPRNQSIHYELDEYGSQVIIFMRKHGDVYEPLSPQAVIPIKFNKVLAKQIKTISGDELLKIAEIDDPRLDENYKEELMQFLKDCHPKLPEDKDSNLRMSLYIGIVIGLLVVMLFFLSYKSIRRGKK